MISAVSAASFRSLIYFQRGLSLDFLYRSLDQQMNFDFDEADEKPDIRDPQLVVFPGSAVVLGVNYYF